MNTRLYNFLSKFNTLVSFKKSMDKFEWQLFRLRCLFKIQFRKLFNHPSQSQKFAVVCTSRLEYVNLTINSINSLHYHNHHNLVTIYTDSLCYRALKKFKSQFDYPDKVKILNLFKNHSMTWQMCKLLAVMIASSKNEAVFDADSRWYCDPIFNRNNPTFLVKAYKFSEQPIEHKLINNLKLPNQVIWHYVTGFIYLPSVVITTQFVKSAITLCTLLISNNNQTTRLAEEISLSICAQLTSFNNQISTLKNEDGPGNKKIIQSLYYGCAHNILK